MFIGLVVKDQHGELPLKSIDYHINSLENSGWIKKILSRKLPNGMLYFDQNSSHFLHSESANQDELFFGGYASEKSSWRGSRHKFEEKTVWGEWVALKLSKKSSALNVKVWNSPSGSWPIYFGSKNNHFAVSNDPHFVGIAIGSESLDLNASFELLKYMHCIGENSTILDVKRLRNEQILLLKFGQKRNFEYKVLQENSHRYAYSTKTTTPKKTFNALLNSVKILEYLNTKIKNSTIQISGGLDSRLTLAILHKNFEKKERAKLSTFRIRKK